MNIASRFRIDGISRYYQIPFRKCKTEDFTKRGLDVSEKILKTYENRFCPEFDKY